MKEENLISWRWLTISIPMISGLAFCATDIVIRAVELHQLKKRVKSNLK
jgi:hypothetical protein